MLNIEFQRLLNRTWILPHYIDTLWFTCGQTLRVDFWMNLSRRSQRLVFRLNLFLYPSKYNTQKWEGATGERQRFRWLLLLFRNVSLFLFFSVHFSRSGCNWTFLFLFYIARSQRISDGELLRGGIECSIPCFSQWKPPSTGTVEE